ncbi:DUF982 domain-containing protein, partial [Mesorhizobium sp. M7A.F.Ca.US.001.01.1.1]
TPPMAMDARSMQSRTPKQGRQMPK